MSDPTLTKQSSWQSTGGCERCDSMEYRLYPEPPGRPHPHCNCTSELVGYNLAGCRDPISGIQMMHAGNNHPSGNPSPEDEFEVVFDYRILCEEGTIFEGQVLVFVRYGDLDQSSDPLNEIWDDGYNLILDIADASCKPCSDPNVS